MANNSININKTTITSIQKSLERKTENFVLANQGLTT
jgi:hypothetical protein